MEVSGKLDLSLRVTVVFLGISETLLISITSVILPFMVEYYLSQESSSPVADGLISEYSGYFEAAYRLTQLFACLFW